VGVAVRLGGRSGGVGGAWGEFWRSRGAQGRGGAVGEREGWCCFFKGTLRPCECK